MQWDPVEHNGYLYVIGGWEHDAGAYDSAYVAQVHPDGSLGPWAASTPLPEPDQGPGVSVWNGWIYAGLHNGHLYRAPVNPDGTLGEWVTESTPAEFHGGRLGVEAYAGNLYLVGGWTHPTFYDDVYVATINPDGSLAGWDSTTAMPQPRQHTSVHFFNDRVYVAGGITSVGNILDSAYSAQVNPDGTLGSWRQEADLPSSLWYHNSLVVENEIFLFGGRQTYSDAEISEIYKGVIDPGDGTISSWIDVGDIPGAFPSGIGAVYAPSAGQAYLIGGSRALSPTHAEGTAEVWATPEPGTLGLMAVALWSVVRFGRFRR